MHATGVGHATAKETRTSNAGPAGPVHQAPGVAGAAPAVRPHDVPPSPGMRTPSRLCRALFFPDCVFYSWLLPSPSSP